MIIPVRLILYMQHDELITLDDGFKSNKTQGICLAILLHRVHLVPGSWLPGSLAPLPKYGEKDYYHCKIVSFEDIK